MPSINSIDVKSLLKSIANNTYSIRPCGCYEGYEYVHEDGYVIPQSEYLTRQGLGHLDYLDECPICFGVGKIIKWEEYE